jgi:hypothetical protein
VWGLKLCLLYGYIFPVKILFSPLLPPPPLSPAMRWPLKGVTTSLALSPLFLVVVHVRLILCGCRVTYPPSIYVGGMGRGEYKRGPSRSYNLEAVIVERSQPGPGAGLWIRIDLIRIRIQHFCSIRIRIQNRIPIQAKTELSKTVSFSKEWGHY